MSLKIRQECKSDYYNVEFLTREAFWNLYVPGATEHYLLNQLRKSPEFIQELDFIAEIDQQIVGNIITTHSTIIDQQDVKHPVITFGPVSILPDFQNKGIGHQLIQYAIDQAKIMGFKAIVIYGYLDYYQRFGFDHSKKYNISNGEGVFMEALLVKELYKDALKGIEGTFHESPIFWEIQENEDFLKFDQTFPQKEKKADTPSQKRFAEMLTKTL